MKLAPSARIAVIGRLNTGKSGVMVDICQSITLIRQPGKKFPLLVKEILDLAAIIVTAYSLHNLQIPD